jgi:hypothetical protein
MTNYLRFIFLKNRAISLGGDQDFAVRFEMREQPLAGSNVLRNGPPSQLAVRPFFFIGPDAEPQDEKCVALLDETPMTPVRPKGMASKVYDFLVDSAMTKAVENKRLNDVVRERIAAYVKSGTIEVTSDPFAIATEPWTEPE